MVYQDCLIPALERVLAWDLPDDDYGAAVAHEAEMLAGVDPDSSGCTWDA